MDINKVVGSLSDTSEPRATIYLNEKSVNSYYNQRVGAIETLVNTEKIGHNLSAGVFNFLKAEVAKGHEIAGTVSLTPELKAILIEFEEKNSKQLVNIRVEEPNKGKLLRYVGDCQFVLWDNIEVPQVNTPPTSVSRVIQKERKKQESFLKFENEKFETFVCVAKLKNYCIAAIASTKWCDLPNLASYGGVPPIGVLGRYESKQDNIFFIAPFWIWHEGW